jgi:hypothetical protein
MDVDCVYVCLVYEIHAGTLLSTIEWGIFVQGEFYGHDGIVPEWRWELILPIVVYSG